MRKVGLLVMTALVTGVATLSGPAPARAYEYPWCVQGRGPGYPGDCSYETYAQCMASASGRTAYCGLNPLAAFAADPRGRPLYRDPYRRW